MTFITSFTCKILFFNHYSKYTKFHDIYVYLRIHYSIQCVLYNMCYLTRLHRYIFTIGTYIIIYYAFCYLPSIYSLHYYFGILHGYPCNIAISCLHRAPTRDRTRGLLTACRKHYRLS